MLTPRRKPHNRMQSRLAALNRVVIQQGCRVARGGCKQSPLVFVVASHVCLMAQYILTPPAWSTPSPSRSVASEAGPSSFIRAHAWKP
eukprot:747815-Amphidinium_carterae.1